MKKNQINQLRGKIFDQIPVFAISKMAKNQFLNWEKVRTCQKCNFMKWAFWPTMGENAMGINNFKRR